MSETPAPPAAVRLIRPSIYLGVLVCIVGAALVAGKLDLGWPLIWEIILMATGVAILLFGIMAALGWRIAVAAMENEAAGLAPPPYDDDEDDDD
tara:strand:+ start:57736 stop:58017 length:282 start_codon:yes stop_codon:yes gene_type:complete